VFGGIRGVRAGADLVASAAISIAFFSLFGSIYALTHYLQDAKPYSARQAGAARVPLALGLVMGAGSSIKLVPRLGTNRIVRAGLAGLGALLATTVLWTPSRIFTRPSDSRTEAAAELRCGGRRPRALPRVGHGRPLQGALCDRLGRAGPAAVGGTAGSRPGMSPPS
jgi:hypothetical protein